MRPELARVVFQLGDRLSQEAILPALRDLQQSQWMGPQELSELSWRRCQALLHYAYSNVPFYQRFYRDAGVHPTDIQGPEDLTRLPVLTKNHVQEAGRDIMPRENCPKFNAEDTSGSTGKPLRIPIDRAARARFLAAKLRGESWYGVQYGDPTARVWSVPLLRRPRLREKLKDRLLNRIRLSVFAMNDTNLQRFLQRCQAFRPRLLYGYSASLTKFADFINDRGLQGCLPSVQAVISTAETLYDHQREVMRRALDVPVASEYGCTEVGIIAFQCPLGAFHITAENVLVEVLRDGHPVPAGETGTLVVTGLHNRSTPFLRYELGDYGSLEAGTCSCGRGLPVMGSVLGRSMDALSTSTGNYLPGWIFDYIIRKVNTQIPGIRGFRVVQTAMDDFLVEMVPAADYGPHVPQQLTAEFRRHIGKGLNIHYRLVDQLPVEGSGKLRYFVSELEAAPDSITAR